MVQPRRHRMRTQQRRDSAQSWIRSGAKVTIKTYAKRYGVDKYTAYADLTAIGFTLPPFAEQWSQRTPAQHERESDPDTHADDDWTMIDGRRYFVAGYTPNGVPYGIFEDELDDRPPSDGDDPF